MSRKRSDSSGLDSLATPMTHRKQPSEIRHVTSDSSASPPSPRPRLLVDSRASTLTEKEPRGGGRGSADSSPQFDSGLVSGTTGSRGSADSGRTFDSRVLGAPLDLRCSKGEVRRCGHHRRHHCSKHRGGAGLHDTVSNTSDQSDTLQSSSSSVHLGFSNQQLHSNSTNNSTTAVNKPQQKQLHSPHSVEAPKQNNVEKCKQHRDITHLYSNLDYVCDQPVYQYIMEQAKLSGMVLTVFLSAIWISFHKFWVM